MNTLSVRTFGALVAVCLGATVAAAQPATARIVGAANSFLATLDEKQRKSVLFAFDDERQRARWSNFPVRMSRLAGLSLGELGASQRSAAMSLVSSALSRIPSIAIRRTTTAGR